MLCFSLSCRLTTSKKTYNVTTSVDIVGYIEPEIESAKIESFILNCIYTKKKETKKDRERETYRLSRRLNASQELKEIMLRLCLCQKMAQSSSD